MEQIMKMILQGIGENDDDEDDEPQLGSGIGHSKENSESDFPI